MINWLDLKLALRFVRSRRKGALTRFISFASTCGIAIGVFAAIVGFSAMNGFEYELGNRVLSIIPSAQLNSSDGYFNDSLAIERTLHQSPHIVATAPAIEQRAILSAHSAFAPLVIAGIDPDKERRVIAIQRFVSTDLSTLAPPAPPAPQQPLPAKAPAVETASFITINTATAPNNSATTEVSDDVVENEDNNDSEDNEDSDDAMAAADDDALAEGADDSEDIEGTEDALAEDGDDSDDAMAAEDVLVAEDDDDSDAEADDAEADDEAVDDDDYDLAADEPSSDDLAQAEAALPRIVIGSGIAKKLQVAVGDTVEVVMLNNKESASTKELSQSLRSPARHKLLVVGIIHIGGQLDTTVALMHYEVLKEMTQLQGPNTIHIKTNDLQDTHDIVYQAIAKHLTEGAYLATWMSSQGKLYHDIQMVRQIMFVAMFLVLAVACFNIVSNLLMLVGEKRREIAILLTMGMKPKDVVRTFSLMGLLSGGYGALLGLIAGVIFSLLLTPVTSSFHDYFGFDLLNEDVYFINFIPCRLELLDVCLVLAVSLLMSWGASLYPAWRAARIKAARELNL